MFWPPKPRPDCRCAAPVCSETSSPPPPAAGVGLGAAGCANVARGKAPGENQNTSPPPAGAEVRKKLRRDVMPRLLSCDPPQAARPAECGCRFRIDTNCRSMPDECLVRKGSDWT